MSTDSTEVSRTIKQISDRLFRRNPFPSNYDTRHQFWEEYKVAVFRGFSKVASHFKNDDLIVNGSVFCQELFVVAAEAAAERRMLWSDTLSVLETATYANHLNKLQSVIVDALCDYLGEPPATGRKKLLRHAHYVQQIKADLRTLAADWTEQAAQQWIKGASQKPQAEPSEVLKARAAWLRALFEKENTDKHDVMKDADLAGVPINHRTIQKILDAKPVYPKTLQKLARVLQVSLNTIPQ
jgi:hypothetical protein